MIHPDYQKRMRLKRLTKWLREHYYDGWQCFYRRNVVGDPMTTVYEQDGITVDSCDCCKYLEIFGLTEKEQRELCQEGEDLIL